MYESNREDVISVNDAAIDPPEKDADVEIKDIFPALQKYKDEHSKVNLQKLCVEIAEFCRSVYASTQNEQEREVYHSMIRKLNN